MVRRVFLIPPVYIIAFFASIVLYPASLLQMNRIVLLCIAFFSVIFLTINSALLPLYKNCVHTKKRLLLVTYLIVGLLVGSVCVLRIQTERSPLRTLARRELISSLAGTVLSDPVPCGPSLYRFPMRVSSCAYIDTSTFSATGLCTVLIPSELVRESFPGGISQGTKKNVLFASGLTLEIQGQLSFNANDSGESFFVSKIKEENSNWTNPISYFRAKLRLSLMRILYDWKEAGGLLLALLSANRDYLSQSLANDFRLSGLAHILALSGMHLSLIGLVTIESGKRIGGKRFAIRLSLIAMLFFVWFAGASPSLDRSIIMALLLIASRALGFKKGILPVLAATGIIQCICNPSDALSLAFLLSYGALWGILTFGENLSFIASRFLPKPVYSEISVSIGAQLLTTPVIAATIGIISPIGILASCLINPFSSIFLLIGIFLIGVTVLIPPLSYWCALIIEYLYQWIAFPVHQFALVRPLSMQGIGDTIGVYIFTVFAGLMICSLSAISKQKRSPDAGFARL